MNTEQLKELIDAVDTWNDINTGYILFFPREPQGYVKEWIEKNNLKYEIIGEPIAQQCGIDVDKVLVVPDNLHKPIKIAYQNGSN